MVQLSRVRSVIRGLRDFWKSPFGFQELAVDCDAGILIRNSLQSRGICFCSSLIMANLCEVGFGTKLLRGGIWAQPGGKTSWKMCFWLVIVTLIWHVGMPSSGRSQSRESQELRSCCEDASLGAGGKGSAGHGLSLWVPSSLTGLHLPPTAPSDRVLNSRAVSKCLGPVETSKCTMTDRGQEGGQRGASRPLSVSSAFLGMSGAINEMTYGPCQPQAGLAKRVQGPCCTRWEMLAGGFKAQLPGRVPSTCLGVLHASPRPARAQWHEALCPGVIMAALPSLAPAYLGQLA